MWVFVPDPVFYTSLCICVYDYPNACVLSEMMIATTRSPVKGHPMIRPTRMTRRSIIPCPLCPCSEDSFQRRLITTLKTSTSPATSSLTSRREMFPFPLPVFLRSECSDHPRRSSCQGFASRIGDGDETTYRPPICYRSIQIGPVKHTRSAHR